MSYVPPHKRLSNTQLAPPPRPEQLAPQMKKNLNLHSDRRTDKHTPMLKRIVYADHSISRCLAVPLQDDGGIPSSVHLVQVSPESVRWKSGHKPLSLIDGRSQQESGDKHCHLRSPWESVAEKVHSDLMSASQNVRNEMAEDNLHEIKPHLVARFGKVLFHWSPSLNLESLKEYTVTEARLRDLRRVFHTDLPSAYVEYIKKGVVPKIGVSFEGEKEQYYIKLADAKQPGSIISCKCRVQEGGRKLEFYKIESSPLRHLVVDTAALDNNVDLRLALCTKRNIEVISDEEKQNISDLISSAILDPNVKGGLKWPLGKANSGAQYSVVGVWHTTNEFYSNSHLRLKVREADRYDFLSSEGYVTREITLKLTGMARILMEPGADDMTVSTSLKDTLKLIWDHFLRWQGVGLVSYCES